MSFCLRCCVVLAATSLCLNSKTYAASLADLVRQCASAKITPVKMKACDSLIQNEKIDDVSKARAHVSRGNLFYKKHSFNKEDAYRNQLSDYNAAIKLDPTYIEAYVLRAVWYHRNNRDYEASMVDLYKAAALNKKSFHVYSLLGLVNRQHGFYEKAFANLSAAIKLKPKSAAAFESRGITLILMREYKKAIIDLSKSIALNPKKSAVYLARARAYEADGDLSRAILDYSKIIDSFPKNALIRLYRGNTYERQKETILAEADYKSAEEISAVEAYKFFAERGVLRVNNGQKSDGLEDFQRASRILPNGYLAKIYIRLLKR